jgi:hypothetical protein
MANNIVLLPAGADAADQIVLTAVANSITWAPTQYGQQGSAVYTIGVAGSPPVGINNDLRGQAFTVAGFSNPSNNGTFLCVASTATTLTLNNPRATAQSGTATASYGTQGFPSQWSSKIANMYSNNQGDNISIEANGGETLIAIAFGLRSFDPFDLKHGTAPYGEISASPLEYTTPFGFTQGLNDFNANPVISDGSTVTPISPVSLQLGVASQFALLAGSTVTNTGSTVVTGGDLGLTPGTSVTGFPPGVLTPPASEQINTPLAVQAQAAALTAYNYYKGLPAGTSVTELAGLTLTPGTYTASSTLDLASSSNVTLNGGGNPNAVFVFQVGSSLTINASSTITLENGAQAANIIWVCGASATVTAPGAMVGTIIAGTGSVTLGGGTFAGRAISLTAAVTISSATAITTSQGTGGAGNNWQLVCNINLVDSDYVAAIPPAAPFANTTPYPDQTKIALPGGGFLYIQIPPSIANVIAYDPANQWQSSKWNLDGYYPSLYVWVATDIEAGIYDINLNSVFQNGIIAPQDLAAGKPIYDGGVNFQVFKLQGTGTPEVSFSIGTSTANPATAPAPIVTTATDGSALFSVGLMKSGNVFAPGTTGGAGSNSPLSLTSVAPLIYGPLSAPVREGGAVYTGTITGGANNAYAGFTFTVIGFVAELGANNGVFVCTASTATTLTLSNGTAVAETHAGSAAYQNQMTKIANGTLVGSEAHYMVEYALTAPGSAGSFNPGFLNPLGYEMVVASIAIKSS